MSRNYKKRRRVADSKVVETAVFPSGNLCGHCSKVHGLTDDIAVAGDEFLIYGSEEEGVVVLSTEAGSAMGLRELRVVDKHFFIWAMSFERTSLRGFSFKGRGGTFCGLSKATDFRFLDDFIVENEREWKGGTDRLVRTVFRTTPVSSPLIALDCWPSTCGFLYILYILYFYIPLARTRAAYPKSDCGG